MVRAEQVSDRIDARPSGLLDDTIWTDRVFLGAGWTAGAGGVRTVVAPATGEILGSAGIAGPADAEKAARTAAEAQREWAALPHIERAAVLRRAGQLWEEHAEEIQWWNIREVGATVAMAGLSTHEAAQVCYDAAALPGQPYGLLLPSEQRRLSMSTRVPAGVVAVISPFNVPIVLGIRSVAPALALGNSVILKPDPRTAVTGGVTIARIFEEAGLPAGVLQVLPGDGALGEALIEHPAVRVISFTGSTAIGRRVGELAARHLKRAHLELGGNSALIVLDDADIEEAANVAAFGAFFHQGQVCMTTGRHVVSARIYDDFVDVLTAKAAALTVGDPATGAVDLGPIIDARQRDRIQAVVDGTLASGGELRTGGTFDGLFYRPTVLSSVTADSPAFAEEIFGPVAPVVSFSSPEEAVQLAASSKYGLSLGIITTDVMKGLELADRIPTGMVHINDQTVSGEANVPFGGVGESGTGSRFGGAQANVDAFTETHWTTVQAKPPVYPF